MWLHLPLPVDMAPRKFFPQSFFKVVRKKRAPVSCCRSHRLPKRWWWHYSTPGCAWAHVEARPFSHYSFLYQKKNRKEQKHHSFLHHSLLHSLSGHFPAREKRKTAPCRAQGCGTSAHAACQQSHCHRIPFIKMASLGPTNIMVTLDTSYCF